MENPRVLIIEDRRENIVFLANNVLKPMGFEIITALDGEKGLQKAREETPDVIITDVKLPKMSGLDVLEALMEEGYSIPAIVMTFHGSEETAVRALRVGAIDYLIKPFSIEDIEGAINRAMRMKERGRADAKNAEGEAPADSGELETLKQANVALSEELEEVKTQLFAAQTALETSREGEETAGDAQLAEKLRETEKLLQAAQGELENAKGWKEEKTQLIERLREKQHLLDDAQNQMVALSERKRTLASGDAAEWENEVARLSTQLASSQQELDTLKSRTVALAQAIKKQMEMIQYYRSEMEKLSKQLHAMAEKVQETGEEIQKHATNIVGFALNE